VRHGTRTAEADELAPNVVTDADIADEDAHLVEVFQIPPHACHLRVDERLGLNSEILDDGAHWEMPVLFVPEPGTFGAIELCFVIVWFVVLLGDPGCDFGLLCGCEKKVVVCRDRDVLALFLV
jgi:hypothetical protein